MNQVVMMKPSDVRVCVARNCEESLEELHGLAIRCKPCAKEYRTEYLRLYMAKKSLRKKMEEQANRQPEDLKTISENHMTGLGTFLLPAFDGDFEREAENVRKLKKYLRLD